jgi:hypothetical protein
MNTVFAYEFSFVNTYRDAVFNKYAGGTLELKTKVREAVDNINKVMTKNPGIKNMSVQVEHDSLVFKVRLSRSV